MNRYLNVGLMQYSIAKDTADNLKIIEENVNILMNGLNRPEIILGPELGLGFSSNDTVPGKITEALGAIAREYNIYLLAGSMKETVEIDGRTIVYNTLPILGPDGTLIDKYRKICPYYPVESATTPGDRYVLFEIKEKKIKIGVMICHDWCFPEISRNLALMGAEILFRPAVDPEGKIIYEAGGRETNHCITLDADMVTKARVYGTFFTEQLVRQIKLFNIPMPFADKWEEAPVFATLPAADRNLKDRFAHLGEIGLNSELGSPIV